MLPRIEKAAYRGGIRRGIEALCTGREQARCGQTFADRWPQFVVWMCEKFEAKGRRGISPRAGLA